MKTMIWKPGNRIELLEGGEEFYPSILAAIESAQSEILLQTYIYTAGEIGSAVAAALIRAAARGLSVHLMVDGFGSQDLPALFLENLRNNKIKVSIFKPLARFYWALPATLHRLHRKILIIDGKLAYLGGINIADDQLQKFGNRSRFDFSAQITGPIVRAIHHSSEKLHLQLEKGLLRTYLFEKTHDLSSPATGSSEVAFIVRDNLKNRKRIEKQYRLAIQSSQSEVILAAAYFFPGFRLLRVLKRAAKKRNVKVKLILQGKAEFPVLKLASEALYAQLLKANVEIYEYEPRLLHAKIAVIDSQWSTIGSCNLEPLSLSFNLEANILVRDQILGAKISARLNEVIQADCQRILVIGRPSFIFRVLRFVAYVALRYLPVFASKLRNSPAYENF